jgi:hypothetical protein
MVSGRSLVWVGAVWLMSCGSDDSPSTSAAAGAGGSSTSGGSSSTAGKQSVGGSSSGSSTGGIMGVAGRGYPDVLDPNDAPPTIGEKGCGFEVAAFCDTFGGASTVRSRGGELHGFFWSGSRSYSQLSATRALGIGSATIPECRPDVKDQVFPDGDALICNPVFDLKSGHLLAASAAQYYGQNGYRVRQPFDFTGRSGKIVFDASMDPLSPLLGWISLAVTEDPISTPGYSIVDNDEGSIIPKNALEVHFANPGGDGNIAVRYLHVFNNYVDTVYSPPGSLMPTTRSPGKVNHFEFTIAQDSIEVSITPFSEDGTMFAAPAYVYKQAVSLPFSRGYVQLNLHNHATLKYSDANMPGGLVNAAVARIDNVGFDGPVITNWREYSVPDSLVMFKGEMFQPTQDPHNLENIGYDIAYVVSDVSKGPGQVLHFKDVDVADAESAKLAVTLYVDFLAAQGKPADYVLQARLNGKAWLERKLSAEEVAFFGDGPTTLDGEGKPMGNPGTQGRLAMLVDVPVADLVAGDNTVEFVTANVPTSYPPLVYNIDLVLQTK